MPQFNPQNLEGRDRLGHIEEYIGTNKSDWFNRQQISINARGLVTESFPIQSCTGSSAPTASDSRSSLVPLRAGDSLSTVYCFMTSVAASGFQVQAGVWDTGGTLLASSASSAYFTTNAAAGNTYASLALSNTYSAASDQAVYVGLWVGGSGQGPILMRGVAQSGTGGRVNANAVRPHAAVGGQPSIGNVTWADTSTAFWFGVS